MTEFNKEDVSVEEITLKGIISSCELMLDDLDYDASIEEKDMQDLIYADNVILNIRQRISDQLKPSNISNAEKINASPIIPKSKGIFNHLRGEGEKFSKQITKRKLHDK